MFLRPVHPDPCTLHTVTLPDLSQCRYREWTEWAGLGPSVAECPWRVVNQTHKMPLAQQEGSELKQELGELKEGPSLILVTDTSIFLSLNYCSIFFLGLTHKQPDMHHVLPQKFCPLPTAPAPPAPRVRPPGRREAKWETAT